MGRRGPEAWSRAASDLLVGEFRCLRRRHRPGYLDRRSPQALYVHVRHHTVRKRQLFINGGKPQANNGRLG